MTLLFRVTAAHPFLLLSELRKAIPCHATKITPVAVIGDGAMTGGLAFEGLNNAGKTKSRLIVVLNDNKMSISKNVGALSRHLAVLRSHPSYFNLKTKVEKILGAVPIVGRPITEIIRRLKKGIKNLFYNSTIFEDMGFYYIGPVDGHDISTLEDCFELGKAFKASRPHTYLHRKG